MDITQYINYDYDDKVVKKILVSAFELIKREWKLDDKYAGAILYLIQPNSKVDIISDNALNYRTLIKTKDNFTIRIDTQMDMKDFIIWFSFYPSDNQKLKKLNQQCLKPISLPLGNEMKNLIACVLHKSIIKND